MISPEHLKIESMDHTPKGGQHSGVIPRGVKVTHLPTGLIACCEHERSQTRNRDIAMGMIEWGVLDIEAR